MPARAPRSILALSLGAILIFALFLLYRAPSLWLWNAWRTDSYYSHALLVAPLALALCAWRLWQARAQAPAAPAWTSAALVTPLAAYGYGFATHNPYWLAWSAWLLAAAVLLATGGIPRLRLAVSSLLLLALCIPTPWTLESGVWLQGLATGASAGLLALVGVPLVVDLYTFRVADVAFEVTAACSGFQSAVSLLAVAAVLVAIAPMPPRRRALVLGLAVPLALALNVVRILAVVGVGVRWGPAAAEGFFHGWSGALLFLAETAVLLAFSGMLRPRASEVSAPG